MLLKSTARTIAGGARNTWEFKLKNYKLYGTSACHLCELAQAMIVAELSRRDEVIVEDVDISDSESLMERYGVKIPVLQHPEGRELNWPFTEEQLRKFLNN